MMKIFVNGTEAEFKHNGKNEYWMKVDGIWQHLVIISDKEVK